MPGGKSMSKRERIEEMGAARIMLSMILEEHPLLQNADSKHCFESFCKARGIVFKEGMDENFYDLHCEVRSLRDMLDEVYCLLYGSNE